MTKLEELEKGWVKESTITCVKPLVTNLQLQPVDNISGDIYPYYDSCYTRTVRSTKENSDD